MSVIKLYSLILYLTHWKNKVNIEKNYDTKSEVGSDTTLT